MNELEPGQIVLYHDRYGMVTKYYGKVHYYTDTVKVYFFDVDREVLLDRSVLKVAEGKTASDYDYALLKYCDCGERYVERPKSHSHWCKFEKLKRGKIHEDIKSSS